MEKEKIVVRFCESGDVCKSAKELALNLHGNSSKNIDRFRDKALKLFNSQHGYKTKTYQVTLADIRNAFINEGNFKHEKLQDFIDFFASKFVFDVGYGRFPKLTYVFDLERSEIYKKNKGEDKVLAYQKGEILDGEDIPDELINLYQVINNLVNTVKENVSEVLQDA